MAAIVAWGGAAKLPDVLRDALPPAGSAVHAFGPSDAPPTPAVCEAAKQNGAAGAATAYGNRSGERKEAALIVAATPAASR